MQTHTTRQAAHIFTETMAAFGLSMDMQTDPALLRDILQECKLDDFRTTHPVMRQWFVDATTQPQPLRPLFADIRAGILAKHPALIEFAELALQRDWFRPSPHVIRAVHVTYLLEALTGAMCNNHSFFIEVQQHYQRCLRDHGINPRHPSRSFLRVWRITHSCFKPLKFLSVDPVMIFLRLQKGLAPRRLTKNQIAALYHRRTINSVERFLLQSDQTDNMSHGLALLHLNIYEAGVTEYRNGFRTNSLYAHALADYVHRCHPCPRLETGCIQPEHHPNTDGPIPCVVGIRCIKLNVPDAWASLYVTWNMAFLLGNIDDLDLAMPNLLLPSLIDAQHDEFIGIRVVSLWLSLIQVFFRIAAGRSISRPQQSREMAIAWAEINKKYALKLAQEETGEDAAMLEASYRKFFAHPLWNLLKLIRKFVL
jgi:hypothetical protein